MEKLFQEPWFLVLWGWVGYNIYALMRAKKTYDKDKSGYLSLSEIGYYFKVEVIPIVFSVWLIPVGVVFAEDIWIWLMDALGKEVPFGNYVYVVMGFLSAILQFLIRKISGGNGK